MRLSASAFGRGLGLAIASSDVNGPWLKTRYWRNPKPGQGPGIRRPRLAFRHSKSLSALSTLAKSGQMWVLKSVPSAVAKIDHGFKWALQASDLSLLLT